MRAKDEAKNQKPKPSWPTVRPELPFCFGLSIQSHEADRIYHLMAGIIDQDPDQVLRPYSDRALLPFKLAYDGGLLLRPRISGR